MIHRYVAWVVPRGDWVDTYPTTNGRIIVGIRLAYLYVLVVLACAVGDSFIPARFSITQQALTAFEIIGWFLGAMLAISAGQFIGKRATAKPELQPTVSETITGEPAIPQTGGATPGGSKVPTVVVVKPLDLRDGDHAPPFAAPKPVAPGRDD